VIVSIDGSKIIPVLHRLYSTGDWKQRTCILINSNINFLLVDSLSNGDLTVVVVERTNKIPLCFASGYFPYEEPEPPAENIRELMLKSNWPLS
jgi:hypothetical protein